MSEYLAKLLNSDHPDKQHVQDVLADYLMNSDDESTSDSGSDTDIEVQDNPLSSSDEEDTDPTVDISSSGSMDIPLLWMIRTRSY